jgi:hypothetical protein
VSLFWYLLTDRGKVNLCEVASKLGINVYQLENKVEEIDRKMNRHYKDYEPPKVTQIESLEELEIEMKKKPHHSKGAAIGH